MLCEMQGRNLGQDTRFMTYKQVAQMANGGAVVDMRAGNLNYSTGTASWLGWGPYLWNHLPPSQAVGARWTAADFDNTSANGFFTDRGDAKVALLLNNYFTLNAFTRCWLMQFGTCQ